MTAGAAENQRAAQAKAAGEALSASTTQHAEAMQSSISGSATDTTDSARTIPSVPWFGEDRHGPAGPSPQP